MAEQTNKDGAVLHFLKELPGYVVVFVALVFFTGIYMATRDDWVPRVLDALMGAFLGLVVNQRQKPGNQTQITTDTVETPSVITDSIDNSTVNTESLNVENKENK